MREEKKDTIMTSTQRQRNATDRATIQHITLIAKGTIKSTGQKFYLVRSANHAKTYTVLVYADHLSCSCMAGMHGQICKHRSVVHQALVVELAQSARKTARHELAMPTVSNVATSIFK
jgi:hypothetical protein